MKMLVEIIPEPKDRNWVEWLIAQINSHSTIYVKEILKGNEGIRIVADFKNSSKTMMLKFVSTVSSLKKYKGTIDKNCKISIEFGGKLEI